MDKFEKALKQEIGNRARIYYLIYRELSEELGDAEAVEILKRAIYERGKEKGELLAKKLGEPDLKKLARAFVEGKEDIDAFGHEVVEVEDDHALLRLNHCPLVEAWEEMGLSPEQQKRMCDMAYQVDFGKFEAAGFRLDFNCRIAEGDTTCDLHVKKR
jgi:predicted ArsR family transcriptional regulator